MQVCIQGSRSIHSNHVAYKMLHNIRALKSNSSCIFTVNSSCQTPTAYLHVSLNILYYFNYNRSCTMLLDKFSSISFANMLIGAILVHVCVSR